MRLRDTETLGASKYSQDLKDGAYGKIDALSSKVAEQFYYYSGYEFARERSESSASLRQKMREHVCESSPNSPTVREDCGNFDWSVYCQSPNSVENEIFLDSAIDFFREAASLSPTDVQKRVKLVRALRKKNLLEEARQNALKALELDSATPHEDRKLSPEDRVDLEEFLRARTNGSNETPLDKTRSALVPERRFHYNPFVVSEEIV